jgi:hypothetical protein
VHTLRWHYTTGDNFYQIVEDGMIKPAVACVEMREKPAVWFSTRQDWEPTANKLLLLPNEQLKSLTREQTERYGGGLCRFGVAPDTAPHHWWAFKRMSGIKPRFARGLVWSARRDGANPADWWVSFAPVPRDQWVAIQVYQHGTWMDVLCSHNPIYEIRQLKN